MAADGGSGGFTAGTGAKSINVGVATSGFTWVKIHLRNTSYKDFDGFSFVGGSFQYSFPAPGENMNTTKAIRIKDTSGTVVIEGTHTGFSGNNINFNLTTNVASPPTMLFEWGN